MNYYIGDLHLFNRNQTDEGRNYDRRPFATVEEMNQYILERWNAKINNGDTVYILGDMAMRGKNSALLALVAQLKGKKICFAVTTMTCPTIAISGSLRKSLTTGRLPIPLMERHTSSA